VRAVVLSPAQAACAASASFAVQSERCDVNITTVFEMHDHWCAGVEICLPPHTGKKMSSASCVNCIQHNTSQCSGSSCLSCAHTGASRGVLGVCDVIRWHRLHDCSLFRHPAGCCWPPTLSQVPSLLPQALRTAAPHAQTLHQTQYHSCSSKHTGRHSFGDRAVGSVMVLGTRCRISREPHAVGKVPTVDVQ
jgi:hypothetical protein